MSLIKAMFLFHTSYSASRKPNIAGRFDIRDV